MAFNAHHSSLLRFLLTCFFSITYRVIGAVHRDSSFLAPRIILTGRLATRQIWRKLNSFLLCISAVSWRAVAWGSWMSVFKGTGVRCRVSGTTKSGVRGLGPGSAGFGRRTSDLGLRTLQSLATDTCLDCADRFAKVRGFTDYRALAPVPSIHIVNSVCQYKERLLDETYESGQRVTP